MDRYFACYDCDCLFENEDDLKIVTVYEWFTDTTTPVWVASKQKAICKTCLKDRLYDPVRGTSSIHAD